MAVPPEGMVWVETMGGVKVKSVVGVVVLEMVRVAGVEALDWKLVSLE